MAKKGDPTIERQLRSCSTAEEFWILLMEVVPQHSRAYLGTLLKRAEHLWKQNVIQFPDERILKFCAQGSDIDTIKVLDFLFAHPSVDTYYEAFLLLKHHVDNRQMLYHYSQQLLRESSDLSYNMASVMSLYFELQLPATFSLRLQPYQLSRLDEGYEAFKKIIKP